MNCKPNDKTFQVNKYEIVLDYIKIEEKLALKRLMLKFTNSNSNIQNWNIKWWKH